MHFLSSKVKKIEVWIYNDFYFCMQTSIGQNHQRLEYSKIIAQMIYIMIKAYLTISIRSTIMSVHLVNVQ
ncbi:uncharacterized protein DS421_8g232970 [Arachis hypogaea]|nr:uncharacterized protein DS421_8g232970 [Arachis hypogaea]